MANSHPNLRTFVRLLGFLRPYRWSLAVSIVLAVAFAARIPGGCCWGKRVLVDSERANGCLVHLSISYRRSR